MRWTKKLADNVRERARSFLRIQPSTGVVVDITETLNWEANAIKNDIWYRGDTRELEQLYSQIPASSTMFWKASAQSDVRKAHTGLPGIIIDILTWIVVSDINKIDVPDKREALWAQIDQENKFKNIIGKAIREALVVGDGAFKLSIDTTISEFPIIEWFKGDRVQLKRKRGRVREVIFSTPYRSGQREYFLKEYYGYGYVKYELTLDGKQVDMATLDETKDLKNVEFDERFIMAYPLMFFENGKYEGRGKSVFDNKIDAFDSLDEAWSQWMQALRQGRSKEYIPEDMLPRDPSTGEILRPNAFDFQYIQTESPAVEDGKKEIKVTQPVIPHESYIATYCTALDQALEGLVSPSTLGIDVKKLDNADAQREKEKVTLYTRNKIVDALQDIVPQLIIGTFAAHDTLHGHAINLEEEVSLSFGEYANPSFESQIETVGKGKTNGIMSIEACVEELYGDSKEESWKAEEVTRLKAEQGVSVAEEPVASADALSNPQIDDGGERVKLNGAQIQSLLGVVSSYQEDKLSRSAAIAIVTETLGVSEEAAERFIEERML